MTSSDRLIDSSSLLMMFFRGFGMRVMVTTPIEVALKVKGVEKLIDEVLYIAKCIERARD